MDGKVILIALGGAILIALYQWKQYQDFLKFMDAYKAQHKVEVRRTGRGGIDWSSLTVALLLFAALAAYTFLSPNAVTSPRSFLLMVVVLIIIFGSSALTSGMSNQIYYTPTGFFLKDQLIDFSRIKGFERSQKGHLVRLTDESPHVLTPQQLVGLDQLHKEGFFSLDDGE